MVPKVIHYCWFGEKPKPDDAIRCIESWKQKCPGYEIKEWNENNFDVNLCKYVRQAYEAKKWAFVSDYARFWILYNFGGLYFDTDVEIIKPIDDLLGCDGFMGVEKGRTMVAPGLGIGFVKGNSICREIKEYYERSEYISDDGSVNPKIVLDFATEVIKTHGYREEDCNDIQMVEGVKIYPAEYFCPIDYLTGVLEKTDKTYSIHWYSGTWISEEQRRVLEFEKKISRIFGKKVGHVAERIYTLPGRIKKKMKDIGVINSIRFAFRKLGILFHKT